MDLFGQALAGEELRRRVGHLSQIAGVRLLTSDNGPSRGVRLSSSAPAPASASRSPSTAASMSGAATIAAPRSAGCRRRCCRAPGIFEDQSGFGWLRAGLGGLNNTCGLIHIGNPEEASVAHYNFPARPTERYGVHDRAALIPAELVSFGERWEDGRLHPRGRRAGHAGADLRREPGADAHLPRRDGRVVVHHGGRRREPRLPADRAHAALPHQRRLPLRRRRRRAHRAGRRPAATSCSARPTSHDPASWSRFIAPQKNWVQQTFEHHMRADADGQVEVAIFNPKLFGGTGVSVRYDHARHAALHRMAHDGRGPVRRRRRALHQRLRPRRQVAEAGELIVLQPGERRTYRTRLGDHRRAPGRRVAQRGRRHVALRPRRCEIRSAMPGFRRLPCRAPAVAAAACDKSGLTQFISTPSRR